MTASHPPHHVFVDLDTLKRLIAAVGMAGAASWAEAWDKAELDVGVWRSDPWSGPERVEVDGQVLALIAESATEAVDAGGDAEWTHEVRAELARVAAEFRAVPPPVRSDG